MRFTMPVFAENSSTTIGDQTRLRKHRNNFNHPQLQEQPPPIIPTDQTNAKKKGITFRGFGCTSMAEVSVPAAIRSSAEWEGKRVRKKKDTHLVKKKKEAIKEVVCEGSNSTSDDNNNSDCLVIQDVWCGPGIGFSGEDLMGSVDCVVAMRNVSGRGKIDGEKIYQKEREREHPFAARRVAVNPETLSFLASDPDFVTSHRGSELSGSRHYHHARHPSPDGLAEIMMLQNNFVMGGRLDQFSGWRLDIDHMSYEQLLALSDRIGYVSTGLKEDEICRCVRNVALPNLNEPPSHLPVIVDKKCSICQEEYETDDELGKLECGHGFHIPCIKQWLAHKNICPVCKTAPLACD